MTKNLYPVFLDLSEASCLVIGGGRVAERKVESLLESGAKHVLLISPAATARLKALSRESRVNWEKRQAELSDIAKLSRQPKMRLAFLCTNSTSAQRALAAECRKHAIWVNVADSRDETAFLSASVIRRGPIQIACSTSGQSPLLAAHLRKKIEDCIDPAYSLLCEIIAEVRKLDMKNRLPASRRRARMDCLINERVLQAIRVGGIGAGRAKANELLQHLD